MCNKKKCARCGEEKEFTSEFFREYKHSRGYITLRGTCKECVTIINKKWRDNLSLEKRIKLKKIP